MKRMTEELWRKAILQLSMTDEERLFVKKWVEECCAEMARLDQAHANANAADRQEIAQNDDGAQESGLRSV